MCVDVGSVGISVRSAVGMVCGGELVRNETTGLASDEHDEKR